MEPARNKNRNVLRNPFYYAAAIAASIACAAAGSAYTKKHLSDQLHQSAVVLRAQSIQHTKISSNAQASLSRSIIETNASRNTRLQARQAQLYSNQAESGFDSSLIAAGGMGTLAVGALVTGVFFGRQPEQRRPARPVTIPAGIITGPEPEPEPGVDNRNGHNRVIDAAEQSWSA